MIFKTGKSGGSILGGFLITNFGMHVTFQIFSGVACVTGFIYYILLKLVIQPRDAKFDKLKQEIMNMPVKIVSRPSVTKYDVKNVVENEISSFDLGKEKPRYTSTPIKKLKPNMKEMKNDRVNDTENNTTTTTLLKSPESTLPNEITNPFDPAYVDDDEKKNETLDKEIETQIEKEEKGSKEKEVNTEMPDDFQQKDSNELDNVVVPISDKEKLGEEATDQIEEDCKDPTDQTKEVEVAQIPLTEERIKNKTQENEHNDTNLILEEINEDINKENETLQNNKIEAVKQNVIEDDTIIDKKEVENDDDLHNKKEDNNLKVKDDSEKEDNLINQKEG